MIFPWIVPFILQGLVITVDEVLFHRLRGLPHWERNGHPIDSLVLLSCLLVPLAFSPTSGMLWTYVGLSVLSCLCITKDEGVHARLCGGGEHWLHALLFILHPVVLIATGFLWTAKAGQPALPVLPSATAASALLTFQAAGVSVFLAHQLIYWRSQPLPEAKPRIDNEFYDDLGERWYSAKNDPIALLRAESRLRNPWIVREVETRLGAAPLRVLDIGCGAGFLSNALAKAGHRVVGIDLSPASLDVARTHDSSGSVDYRQMNATALEFPDASFDVVTSMDFLEHISDRDQFIAEVQRVLKPGGLFFFHTFNRNPLAWLIVIKGVEWFVPNVPKNMHVYELLYRPRELRTACTRNNLVVEEIRGVRPNIFSRAFWRMIATGLIEDDFSFEFTRSQMIGYSGYARKHHLRPGGH